MCRTTQAASVQVTGLQLLAAPAIAAFTPTSQPGLMVTMPYRSVYFGETIKVSLQAVNPLMRGITGFTLPLRYDTTLLEFREARSSALWQQVTVTPPRADGGNYFVVSLSAGRSGTQPDTASVFPALTVGHGQHVTLPAAVTPFIYACAHACRSLVYIAWRF
jgi:hypothetical protein